MKITTYIVMSQIYILPYIKVTYDRVLNGNYELIVGWINREISISI